MLKFLKFWKKKEKKERVAEKKEEKGKTIGDLYERLGVIKEGISILSSGQKELLNEFLTIRKRKERILDLKDRVKSLKQLLPKIASHNVRIDIYKELSQSKTLTTKKLLKQLKCSKPTIYKHLKWLEDKGIIKADRKERPVKWSLR